MRKSNREIKEFSDIVNLIDRCDTLRIGINDDIAPYILPVSFGYEVIDGTVVFYIHGAKEGHKHDLIAKNNNVFVEGDLCHRFMKTENSGYTCDYESFMGTGVIETIIGEEAHHGIDLLMKHCGFAEYTVNEKVYEIMTVQKITVKDITGKSRQ